MRYFRSSALFFSSLCACMFGLTLLCAPTSTEAKRKKKPKETYTIKRTFSSKAPFGKTAKSKKRGQWVKVYTVKAHNQLMEETLGKKIPVLCRLNTDDLFECEARNAKNEALTTESTQWPAGKTKLLIHVQKLGISIELSNNWKKHVKTKGKKK